jgi:GNAT superfamily N-acetyltransferase
MRIRRLTEADAPFLERMMLVAGFPPDRPLPSDARSMPHVRRFVEGWGRAGDVGVIALSETGRPLGAAWARQLDEPLLRDEAGASVAEVAIGVEDDARRAGTGSALLRALAREAATVGHRGLSLRVSPRNPAVRLYERAGYELVGHGEHGLVMRRQLG